jgi:chromosome segregation ATPase
MHPPKPTPAELHLIKENDSLRTTIVCLRHELTNKEEHVGRLHVLMRERIERIDELNGKIEQLRAQNKRLDAENEHLAEMVRFAPQLDAAMSAQKLDQA